jgi:hypothetical protein
VFILCYCDRCDLLLFQATATLSREKPGTSDAAAADVNTRVVLRGKVEKLITMCVLFKEIAIGRCSAKTDLSKTRELTAQACEKGSGGYVARLGYQIILQIFFTDVRALCKEA